MKSILNFMALMALSMLAIAQAPQAISYQAVVRDNSGNPLANRTVGVRISILSGSSSGTAVYVETHSATTNAFGLVNLEIGRGTVVSGTFTGIGWGTNTFYAKIDIDQNGGTAYQFVGTSQLLSVPYALQSAKSSDNNWTTSNTNIYNNNSGNVGIGLSNPTAKLDVSGTFKLVNGSQGSGKVLTSDANGLATWQTPTGSSLPAGTSGQTLRHDGTNWLANSLLYNNGTSIGIGTASPSVSSKLHVSPGKIFLDGTTNPWVGLNNGTTLGYLEITNGVLGLTYNNAVRLGILSSGYVGIGTVSPTNAPFHVNLLLGRTVARFGGTNALYAIADYPQIGFNAYYNNGFKYSTANYAGVIGLDPTNGRIFLSNTSSSGTADAAATMSERISITNSGNVGIGITTPVSRLDVKGNVTVRDASTGAIVVELGTGLDYAEGFNVIDKKDIAPGTILSIDPQNEGKLVVCAEAYDKKVAGIVAGANGLGSGVKLGSGQFDFDVALAGRVYCNVIASEEPIKAGDLLTTSAVPGFAMKAKDLKKAKGAILGKAMESMEKGQSGQILVLVSLQ